VNRFLERLTVSALLAAALLACSCSSSEEKELTLTEFLEENSTLIGDLGSYDNEKRREAYNRLKQLPREQGINVCLGLLMEKKINNPRAEVVLARCLADWRDRRAIEYLFSYLALQDLGDVRMAAEGLEVFLDDPRVVAVLRDKVTSPVLQERRIATEILRGPPDRRPDNEVVELFAAQYKSEKDPEIRARFLFTIGGSRHPRKAGFLADALTDADEGLRALAWRFLQKEPQLPPEFDFDPGAAPADRADAVARLRLWLKARGEIRGN
ncbi:MAG: hypothetical protein JXA90_15820, partial [Planctomycetes bacterium]|nr:hypothetical protein [Planctomycetota bacterium]